MASKTISDFNNGNVGNEQDANAIFDADGFINKLCGRQETRTMFSNIHIIAGNTTDIADNTNAFLKKYDSANKELTALLKEQHKSVLDNIRKDIETHKMSFCRDLFAYLNTYSGAQVAAAKQHDDLFENAADDIKEEIKESSDKSAEEIQKVNKTFVRGQMSSAKEAKETKKYRRQSDKTNEKRARSLADAMEATREYHTFVERGYRSIKKFQGNAQNFFASEYKFRKFQKAAGRVWRKSARAVAERLENAFVNGLKAVGSEIRSGFEDAIKEREEGANQLSEQFNMSVEAAKRLQGQGELLYNDLRKRWKYTDREGVTHNAVIDMKNVNDAVRDIIASNPKLARSVESEEAKDIKAINDAIQKIGPSLVRFSEFGGRLDRKQIAQMTEKYGEEGLVKLLDTFTKNANFMKKNAPLMDIQDLTDIFSNVNANDASAAGMSIEALIQKVNNEAAARITLSQHARDSEAFKAMETLVNEVIQNKDVLRFQGVNEDPLIASLQMGLKGAIDDVKKSGDYGKMIRLMPALAKASTENVSFKEFMERMHVDTSKTLTLAEDFKVLNENFVSVASEIKDAVYDVNSPLNKGKTMDRVTADMHSIYLQYSNKEFYNRLLENANKQNNTDQKEFMLAQVEAGKATADALTAMVENNINLDSIDGLLTSFAKLSLEAVVAEGTGGEYNEATKQLKRVTSAIGKMMSPIINLLVKGFKVLFDPILNKVSDIFSFLKKDEDKDLDARRNAIENNQATIKAATGKNRSEEDFLKSLIGTNSSQKGKIPQEVIEAVRRGELSEKQSKDIYNELVKSGAMSTEEADTNIAALVAINEQNRMLNKSENAESRFKKLIQNEIIRSGQYDKWVEQNKDTDSEIWKKAKSQIYKDYYGTNKDAFIQNLQNEGFDEKRLGALINALSTYGIAVKKYGVKSPKELKGYVDQIEWAISDKRFDDASFGINLNHLRNPKSAEEAIKELNSILDAVDIVFNKGLQRFANGGILGDVSNAADSNSIIKKPVVGMVGEDGPEMVVPLSKPKRAKDLLALARDYYGISLDSPNQDGLAKNISNLLADIRFEYAIAGNTDNKNRTTLAHAAEILDLAIAQLGNLITHSGFIDTEVGTDIKKNVLGVNDGSDGKDGAVDSDYIVTGITVKPKPGVQNVRDALAQNAIAVANEKHPYSYDKRLFPNSLVCNELAQVVYQRTGIEKPLMPRTNVRGHIRNAKNLAPQNEGNYFARALAEEVDRIAQKGDLLFTNWGEYDSAPKGRGWRHMGVYVGNNMWANASSSKGSIVMPVKKSASYGDLKGEIGVADIIGNGSLLPKELIDPKEFTSENMSLLHPLSEKNYSSINDGEKVVANASNVTYAFPQGRIASFSAPMTRVESVEQKKESAEIASVGKRLCDLCERIGTYLTPTTKERLYTPIDANDVWASNGGRWGRSIP